MHTVNQVLEEKGHEVFSIAPDAAVLKAIEQMAERGIGALLVMDGRALVGIVSERDYARKVILQGRSSRDTPVREIMTAKVITAAGSQTVHHCMQAMTNQRIRHLPVVNNGEVVGVLSIGDLVRTIIADQKAQIEQLENYIAS